MNKRIIFLTIALAKGGAENQLIKLALYLKNKGYNVKVLALMPANDFEEVIENNKLEYELVPFDKGLGVYKLYKVIKENNTDVLVSFMFGANIVARVIKAFLKVKLITSVRVNEISTLYRFLYKLTYRLDNVSTFNSEISLKKFKDEKLTIADRSFLVNNAISIPKKKNKSFFENEVFTFISIAHFRPQKDYKTLFKSIKIIKDLGYEINLFVLGHLGGESWPQEMLIQYNIEDNVSLLGFVNEPEMYIDKADALVLSTFWEGTPNAILEGMANQLPIISSEVPGCKELLEKSGCGYLAKGEDPNDLANKMIELMSLKKEVLLDIGRKGYSYVNNNYKEDKIFRRWEELIN